MEQSTGQSVAEVELSEGFSQQSLCRGQLRVSTPCMDLGICAGQSSESGIVFQPAEVEDVIVETIDEDNKHDGEADLPYSKPHFPALTPKLGENIVWEQSRN